MSLSFCMVTTFYPPTSFGGDAMHVYRLSNELARRGHRVTVIHSLDAYRAVGGQAPVHDFPNEPGVTLHPIESRFSRANSLSTYLRGRPGNGLASALSEPFDVIHFHNVSLVGGPGVLGLGDAIKLYTTHEHWLVCPMHVLWKNNREPCVTPQCLRCTLAFHRPPQLWRYSGLLERKLDDIDLFLSPSAFTIEAHRARGFTRPMRRLPYFVPVSEGDRTAPEPERPYFLFVGRLEKLKGLQTLIERFRTYREADLVVAGDGTYGDELRRQAAGLDHVRFVGRLDPHRLAPLYAGAIALIAPSVGFEVFGIVALEALAQGTPAIVRDLGGLPELVRESGGGIVYRTEAELTEAMEMLRLDPVRRAELGETGRAAWRATWSDEPHLAGYFAAIDEARERTAP